MKHLKRLFTILAIAIVAGCASTNEIVTDTTKRAPTTSVDVFKDGHAPDKQYKEIAELSFLGPREDELRAEKHFVERARKMGGNGILFSVVLAGQKSGGSMYGFSSSTAWVFKGKVIVYQ